MTKIVDLSLDQVTIFISKISATQINAGIISENLTKLH